MTTSFFAVRLKFQQLNVFACFQDMMAEARLLRQHKGRLEARMQILEEHNRQLEAQLQRLRRLLDEVGEWKTIEGTEGLSLVNVAIRYYTNIYGKITAPT